SSALRPQYEAAVQGMDPIEAEMQLRDWSRENVIERVLLRQEAASDPEPISMEAFEVTLRSLKSRTLEGEEELRKDVEIRMRVDRLLEKTTSRVAPPKHKEVSDYYRKNKEQ